MTEPWLASFEKDGVIYTDYITSVKYSSGGVTYPELTRWQRFVRWINPWRKPLRPIRTLPTVELQAGPYWESDPAERLAKTIRSMEQSIKALQ